MFPLDSTITDPSNSVHPSYTHVFCLYCGKANSSLQESFFIYKLLLKAK